MINDITLAELITDLDQEIASSSAQGFWTAAMKKDWLNRAGQRVCGFYRWPFLELSVYTTTRNQKEYYTYPKGELRFKPNSIYEITIEDEEYPVDQQGRGRSTWEQFTLAKQNADDDYIFANHNSSYFLYPIPQDGKEMCLYGLRAWQELGNDSDTPITPPEFDAPLVRLAKAYALRKAKKYKEAQAEMVEVLDPNMGELAMLKMEIESENASGYGGQATSSRWQ